MKDFFASLYELWGLNPLLVEDLGDHLRGLDIICEGYGATSWYTYIGSAMVTLTLLSYATQYHFIDSNRYSGRLHLFITSIILMVINFLIAFSIPFNALQTSNYCSELNFNSANCIGFGISNALWSFILFAIITSLPWPRSKSINCSHTVFWKS